MLREFLFLNTIVPVLYVRDYTFMIYDSKTRLNYNMHNLR